MAQYPVPKEIQPLARLMTDFAHACGYDPLTVFNDFLTFVIHGFSPGAPPLKSWKYKRQQNAHSWAWCPNGCGSCKAG